MKRFVCMLLALVTAVSLCACGGSQGGRRTAHGKQIKNDTTMDMAFIITNSEDDQGYIPDENACEHSYYEYDIAKYARETGTELAERYVEILTALQNDTTPAPRS